jgi:hypothetical protein
MSRKDGRRRVWLAALLAAGALAGGAFGPGLAAKPAVAAPAAIARTCGADYRHAVIAGAEKCLRAGEFCTHSYDRQYRRYGYRCIRYYANVHRYRLTYA